MASSTSPRSTRQGFHCTPANSLPPGRERRPRRSAQQHPKQHPHLQRIRTRSIVGKGLALSAQHTVRHGTPFGESATRLRIRRSGAVVGAFAAGRGKPLPYGGRLRIRLGFCRNAAIAAGAPGSARPTGLRLRILRTFGEKRAAAARASGTPPPTWSISRCKAPIYRRVLPFAGKNGLTRSFFLGT